jgi:hypothetical protein
MRVFKKKRKDKKVMLSSVNHPLRKINENKRFDFWDLFDNNKFKFIIYWIFCFEFLLHPWQTRQWLQKRKKDTRLFDTVKQLESQDVSENLYHVMSQEAAILIHFTLCLFSEM